MPCTNVLFYPPIVMLPRSERLCRKPHLSGRSDDQHRKGSS